MVFWVSPPLNANVLFCKFVLNLTPYMTKLKVLVWFFPLLYRQLYYMEKRDGHGFWDMDMGHGPLCWMWIVWRKVLNSDEVKVNGGDASLWRRKITYVVTRSWILNFGITSFRIFTFMFSEIWLNLSMEDHHFGYITKLTPPPQLVLQLGNQPFFWLY
jgi:hypothetical protein